MKTIHIIVSGRVQGVYFRAFTQNRAVKQGVTGFVRNKDDGTVEIVASANQDKLDQFVNWCNKGPLMAKVSQVIVNEYIVTEPFTQFEVR
ncbi:MAG: acylphosphatase [Methylococcales bacterium]|nr:acylphosphatase [Methylococcales bacterium]MCK5478709.1 acylphosphatase [Methylococcales bacterium]